MIRFMALCVALVMGVASMAAEYHRALVFRLDCGYVRKFGEFGTTAGTLNYPSGIAASLGGVYIGDYYRLQTFSSLGKFRDSHDAQYVSFERRMASGTEHTYVTDNIGAAGSNQTIERYSFELEPVSNFTMLYRIHRMAYSSATKMVYTLAQPTTGTKQVRSFDEEAVPPNQYASFSVPGESTAIATDEAGLVYVFGAMADGTPGVQVYSSTGTLQSEWPCPYVANAGTTDAGGSTTYAFGAIHAVYQPANGLLYFTGRQSGRSYELFAYTKTGTFVSRSNIYVTGVTGTTAPNYGTTATYGNGVMRWPTGIAVDGTTVYVLDQNELPTGAKPDPDIEGGEGLDAKVDELFGVRVEAFTSYSDSAQSLMVKSYRSDNLSTDDPADVRTGRTPTVEIQPDRSLLVQVKDYADGVISMVSNDFGQTWEVEA